MSDAVMGIGHTENRKTAQHLFTDCVIYALGAFGQTRNVFTTEEILAMLDARGVKNSAIARTLKLNPSRITELKKGERKLKLEEAVTLVRTFGLESGSAAPQLPPSILRLVVQYVASQLGVPQERTRERVEGLTEDLRALSELVADPDVKEIVGAADGFLRAMHLRRLETQSKAPQGSDPAPAQ